MTTGDIYMDVATGAIDWRAAVKSAPKLHENWLPILAKNVPIEPAPPLEAEEPINPGPWQDVMMVDIRSGLHVPAQVREWFDDQLWEIYRGGAEWLMTNDEFCLAQVRGEIVAPPAAEMPTNVDQLKEVARADQLAMAEMMKLAMEG